MSTKSHSIIHELMEAVDGVFAKHSSDLDEFLAGYKDGRWIIASDYYDDLRNNTLTMTFALIPVAGLSSQAPRISRSLPHDLKDICERLSPDSIQFLRDGEFFAFNFILNRPIELIPSAELCALSLTNTLADLQSHLQFSDAAIQQIMPKLKAALRKERAESFKRKCNEIGMLGVLGASVAMCAATHHPLTEIYWVPDRDNMTGIWDGLVDNVFQVNLSATLAEKSLPTPARIVRFDDPAVGGMPHDPYIRIADYFARPASSVQQERDARGDKCNQILDEVFVNNPRVITMALLFKREEAQRRIILTDILVSPRSHPEEYQSGSSVRLPR